MPDEYAFERAVSREVAAAILRTMGDGVATGSVRLGDDEHASDDRSDEAVVVDVPDRVTAEIEYETGDVSELEIELAWRTDGEGDPGPVGSDADADTDVVADADTDDEAVADVDAAADADADTDADDEAVADADADTVADTPTDADADAPADATAIDAATENGTVADPVGDPPTDEAMPATPVGAGDGVDSKARFELYQDRAGEWRWRLVHHNGNIIADGGEGYARKRTARTGLRSVMRNAPGAEIVEEESD